MVLEDGTGSGRKQKVDRFNRATVFSTGTTQEHHAAGLGVAFSFQTALLALGGAAEGGYLLVVKNTDAARLLGIQKLIVSKSAPGALLEVVRNPVLGTLSSNTVITGVNTNFGSGGGAKAEASKWDGAGTTGIGGITGGTVMETHVLGSEPLILPVDGAWDLPTNSVIGFRVVAVVAGNVALNLRAFFEEVPPPAPS